MVAVQGNTLLIAEVEVPKPLVTRLSPGKRLVVFGMLGLIVLIGVFTIVFVVWWGRITQRMIKSGKSSKPSRPATPPVSDDDWAHKPLFEEHRSDSEPEERRS